MEGTGAEKGQLGLNEFQETRLTMGILGIKAKVENKGQYDEYLEELKPLREELGVSLKEDLYPESK
jgi:hypothetical protein